MGRRELRRLLLRSRMLRLGMAVMLLVMGVAERRIDSDGCGHADKQAAPGPAVGVLSSLFFFSGGRQGV
jgi:hypothetical protein